MITLDFLTIFACAWAVALLCARLIEELVWAGFPETIHRSRVSDRAIKLISCTALALIAISLWRMS